MVVTGDCRSFKCNVTNATWPIRPLLEASYLAIIYTKCQNAFDHPARAEQNDKDAPNIHK